jgi:flavodoxin II
MEHDIAVIYGSTTGNIENAACQIAELLAPNRVALFDIAVDTIDIDDFDLLIFGISTWEFGGLQEDWIDYFPRFQQLEFSGKLCALFGQGNQEGYDEWFQDGLLDLHSAMARRGARIIGLWPNVGYHFKTSKGLTADGKYFLGLALDDDNQPELTTERVARWTAQILASLSASRDTCGAADGVI